MRRLPRGTKAQIIGYRSFQTMYTAEQMRKAVAEERENFVAFIQEYPYWIGDNAKRDIIATIRSTWNK